jgi:hypothetical protein
MKEMIYKTKHQIEILDKGVIEKFEYAIISMGLHPCAYIKLNKNHKFYNMHHNDIDIQCHYGLTYSASGLHSTPDEQDVWWIGWDYAHIGDYFGCDLLFKNTSLCSKNQKKWTTQEILEEVKDVIRQLKEVKQ